MIIVGKIDCTKIEKNRLFVGKKGQKYLDIMIRTTEEQDQYGNNGMIVQSVSKEERAKGIRGPILGNCKVLSTSERPAPAKTVPAPASNPHKPDPDEEIPF